MIIDILWTYFAEFPAAQLRESLMPVVERLYRQEPEAVPFRTPVDPERLQIPVRTDIL